METPSLEFASNKSNNKNAFCIFIPLGKVLEECFSQISSSRAKLLKIKCSIVVFFGGCQYTHFKPKRMSFLLLFLLPFDVRSYWTMSDKLLFCDFTFFVSFISVSNFFRGKGNFFGEENMLDSNKLFSYKCHIIIWIKWYLLSYALSTAVP